MRTRTHDDVILAEMPEFWELVLKIMDDIKESVRKSASKTSGKPAVLTCILYNKHQPSVQVSRRI